MKKKRIRKPFTPRQIMYRTWAHIHDRCYKPHAAGYKNYGGRGITVCERWHTFANFHADMGDRPEGLTLDRWPDGNGNYEPGNCRWATMTDQIKNRCKTIWITYQGETLCAKDWAKRLGLNYGTVKSRLKRGWPHEMVLTYPMSASNGSKFRQMYACSRNESGTEHGKET